MVYKYLYLEFLQMNSEPTFEGRRMNVWNRWLYKDSSWEDYECDFRDIASENGSDVFCETNVGKIVE